MIDRFEFNILGIGNCAPNNFSGAVVFEPAAIGVVPAEIRVDGVIHRRNIALTWDLTVAMICRE